MDTAWIQVFVLTLSECVAPAGKAVCQEREFDLQFLTKVFEDAQHIRPLLERHPEWQSLAAKMIHLYKEITDKALENEKKKGNSTD